MSVHRWWRRRVAWAGAGALLGAALAALLFAPAAWLATAVADASGGRLLLADARGTLWTGSASVVLQGGAGSSAAAALPGRLSWKLRPRLNHWLLRARQECCLAGEQRIAIVTGFGGLRLQWLPPRGAAPALHPIGQLPASVLAGLGAPWNSLDPGGLLRLAGQGLTLSRTQGRLALAGRAELRVDGLSSRATSVPMLGDYLLAIDAGEQLSGGSATLALSTLRGPLLLSGSGQFGGAAPLRFRGLARAEAGSEEALNNLLNMIGRREGPVSHLSIG